MNKSINTIVCKMHPANNFGPDILGETGCVNCGDSIVYPVDIKRWMHATGKFLSSNVSSNWNKSHTCSNPQPKKAQTIRDKPIKIGQKVELWEMWKGMEKGQYSTCCWSRWGDIEHTCCGAAHLLENTKNYPRKLLDAEIIECVSIKMRTDGSFLYVMPAKYEHLAGAILQGADTKGIPYEDSQHSFVKADGFKTNKQFIDFMLKWKPEIKKDWVPMWIWKW